MNIDLPEHTKTTGEGTSRDALEWLRRSYLSVRRRMDEELAAHGMSASQLEVLARLWSEDGLEQRMLQETLNIRGPTLTSVVDGLVARGWVTRRESPDDARVKQLFLTGEGRARRERLGEEWERFQARVLEGFSPEEVDLLRTLLQRVAANSEDLKGQRIQ